MSSRKTSRARSAGARRHLAAIAPLYTVAVLATATMAAAVSYPGTAPCGSTLQACIDGVPNNTTIDIVTSEPIDESITIGKSLILRSGAGSAAVIGGGAGSTVRQVAVVTDTSTGGAISVRIERLRLDNARLTASFQGAAGSSLAVVDSEVELAVDSDAVSAIHVRAWRDAGFFLGSSKIVSAGRAVTVGAPVDTNGALVVQMFGNRISGRAPGKSVGGIEVLLDGSGFYPVVMESNVVSSVADCLCGTTAGILVRSKPDALAEVVIAQSTIDRIGGQSPGIRVVGIGGAGAGASNLQLFNNIVTDLDGPPVQLVNQLGAGAMTVAAGPSAFFDFGTPPQWAGFAPGEVLTAAPGYLDAAAGDYRLRLDSPLIDRGRPDSYADLDAAGNVRREGPTTDLGAYEAAAGDNRPRAAFVHHATPQNVSSRLTSLDHPLLNGNPQALPFVIANASAGQAQGHPIGVYYSGTAQRWMIFNEDGADMDAGQAFNVVVPPAGATVFAHQATPGNTINHVTYIDRPALNGRARKRLLVTQSYNPGGGLGFYNNSEIAAVWDPTFERWGVLNENLSHIQAGVSFHVWVLVSDADALPVRARRGGSAWMETDGHLSQAALNGRPNAVLLATHAWNVGGVLPKYNPGSVAALFDAVENRWMIDPLAGQELDQDVGFFVLVASPLFASDFETGLGGWSLVKP